MKHTTLLLLFILSFSAVFAQTGSSYLMMNFNLNKNKNYYSPGHFYSHSNNPFPIGLQWVKYNTENTAIRFGFTIFKKTYFQIITTHLSVTLFNKHIILTRRLCQSFR
jgi:hypothetical protein